ncbi:hypothetical protein C7S18_05620 [Ahniella affigens]|uniref:TubC N-terminal docking domain-containing protein n=1 Tax=Ahniella affigens TaxID=2021234 RepID=A0A2P1PPD8_9GAMM|nr:hypothetical protein [Ahniella affigens]AVP96711.1 hypothetical protein C7S18_05620 [Ahniella affigens]
MSAEALLNELRQAGARVGVRNGRLTIDAPAGLISPEVRCRLTESKAELLMLLAPRLPTLCAMQFSLHGDPPDTWHTALGQDAGELITDLRERYQTRLAGVRSAPQTKREQP